jgi:hypothetical protein
VVTAVAEVKEAVNVQLEGVKDQVGHEGGDAGCKGFLTIVIQYLHFFIRKLGEAGRLWGENGWLE